MIIRKNLPNTIEKNINRLQTDPKTLNNAKIEYLRQSNFKHEHTIQRRPTCKVDTKIRKQKKRCSSTPITANQLKLTLKNKS